MHKTICLALAVSLSTVALADEVFVVIQKVDGQQVIVTQSAGGGRGMRRSGDAASGTEGRRRRGPVTGGRTTTFFVPEKAKITMAQRERRTGEFRVGVELSGALKNRVFRNIAGGLPARIVIEGNRVTEINAITAETDINQANANAANGAAVIAVRPKRPPSKK